MIIFMKTIISRKMMMITTITLYLTRNQQLGCGLVHPSPPSSPAAAAAAYIICHDTPSSRCCFSSSSYCCLYHLPRHTFQMLLPLLLISSILRRHIRCYCCWCYLYFHTFKSYHTKSHKTKPNHMTWINISDQCLSLYFQHWDMDSGMTRVCHSHQDNSLQDHSHQKDATHVSHESDERMCISIGG